MTKYYNHPVVNGANRINGGFGDWYSILGRPPYQHRGVDYDASNEQVLSPMYGRIQEFPDDSSFGLCRVIRDDSGMYTILAHMRKTFLSAGDQIEPGTPLGISGSTGFSTAEHVHFQLCTVNWFPADISYSRNPLDYMEVEEMGMTPEEKASFNQLLTEFSSLKSKHNVLENIVAAYGITLTVQAEADDPIRLLLVKIGVTVPNGKGIVSITGEKALEFLDKNGNSLYGGLISLNDAVLNHVRIGH